LKQGDLVFGEVSKNSFQENQRNWDYNSKGPYEVLKVKKSDLDLRHVENKGDKIRYHVSRCSRYREGDVRLGDYEYEVEEIVDQKEGGDIKYRVRF
jgi:hypothetical protein